MGSATIDFNVFNTQAPNIHCAGFDSDGYMDSYFKHFSPMTYYCGAPLVNSSTPANFTLIGAPLINSNTTNFTFSRFANEIIVNQPWSGSPIGGSVSTYMVTASGNATLECSSNTWINPDWKGVAGGGINYSVDYNSCKGADLKMRIDRIKAIV